MSFEPNIIGSWNPGIGSDFGGPVDIYIDTGCYNYVDNPNTLKILFLCEPPEIYPDLYLYTLANYDKYDYIITYYDKILNYCPNAVYYMHTQSWIPDDYVPFSEKAFGVSTVVGYKLQTQGHWLRHALWEKQHFIKNIPAEFFASQHGGYPRMSANDVFALYRSKKILGNSKLPLFSYQFHIAIENVRMDGMFTEKILDCFRTKTVPIYWGCKDIGQYFNNNGIICCNSVDEILDACNALSHDTYDQMREAIDDNYLRSLSYRNSGAKLGGIIRELVNKKWPKPIIKEEPKND